MPFKAVSDDYVPPVFLTDEARDLNDRFYLILNNLVAAFPYAKTDPTGLTMNNVKITNEQDYQNSMNDMLKLQSDYFSYKNNVVYASEYLLKEVNVVDAQINILDVENTALKSQLYEMANSSRSAQGMLDDTQLTRNQLFYGNVALSLVMMAGGYLYYKKVYKAKPT
jgi:hypothetical protein